MNKSALPLLLLLEGDAAAASRMLFERNESQR